MRLLGERRDLGQLFQTTPEMDQNRFLKLSKLLFRLPSFVDFYFVSLLLFCFFEVEDGVLYPKS